MMKNPTKMDKDVLWKRPLALLLFLTPAQFRSLGVSFWKRLLRRLTYMRNVQ